MVRKFSAFLVRQPHLFYLFYLLSCFLWLWNRLPYHNDILVYDYPERILNLQSLDQGWIPLWNPFITCGLPHLANWQSAVFYPPYWFLNSMNFSRSLVALTLLHSAWAYLGFFLWAKTQTRNVWLCALGAFSFAGSAHLTHCWVNLHFVATASWIPWVFWTFQRLLQKPQWKNILGATLVLAFQILAGYPIFVFYTGLALFVWFVFQKPPIATWKKAGLTVAFSIAVTALQWLPFLDFLTYATHGDWETFPYYLHPWEWRTFLDPTYLGIPEGTTYRGNSTNALFANLYFGLIPFFIWVVGLAWKRIRSGFWGIFSLVVLIWMTSYSAGLTRFIPQKIFDFLEPSKSIGLFLFASCAFLISFFSPIASQIAKKPDGKPWMALVAALWIIDLTCLPFRLIYRIPDPFQNPVFQKDAQTVKDAVQGQRILSIKTGAQISVQGAHLDETLMAKMSDVYVGGFLPNTNQVWGIRSANAYLSLATAATQNITRYFNKGFPYNGDLLDVAGVGLFLLPQPLSASKYRVVDRLEGDYLIRNSQASSDMRWAEGQRELPDRPSVLNQLARPGSRWRERVYLERNPDRSLAQLPPLSGARTFPSSQGYRRETGSRASWGQTFPRPGYVTFNETCAPGWYAWVDGKATSILRAYGLFMAVPVGPGFHQVDFRYEPVSVRLGFFLSLLALAGIAAAGGVRFRGSRPSSGELR